MPSTSQVKRAVEKRRKEIEASARIFGHSPMFAGDNERLGRMRWDPRDLENFDELPDYTLPEFGPGPKVRTAYDLGERSIHNPNCGWCALDRIATELAPVVGIGITGGVVLFAAFVILLSLGII